LKEAGEDGGGLVQLVEVEPFVIGVCLGDISGAEDNGGIASHGDGGGVSKIIDSPWFPARGSAHELPNEGEVRVGLKSGTGDTFEVESVHIQITGAEKRVHFAPDAGIGFAGNGAAIDVNGAAVRDNVGLVAPANDAYIYGGRTKQGVAPFF
jgi:hypothetical protein